MYYTEKCPKCGAEQIGLDLKESNGWVECNKCGTKFQVNILESNEKITKEETTG